MAKSFFEDCVGDLLDTARSDCAFGKLIKYQPKDQRRQLEFNAIYDSPFEQVDPDTEVVIASNQFSIGIKMESLCGLKPQKGDRVYVCDHMGDNHIFRVVDSQEDGQGGAQLILHKAC